MCQSCNSNNVSRHRYLIASGFFVAIPFQARWDWTVEFQFAKNISVWEGGEIEWHYGHFWKQGLCKQNTPLTLSHLITTWIGAISLKKNHYMLLFYIYMHLPCKWKKQWTTCTSLPPPCPPHRLHLSRGKLAPNDRPMFFYYFRALEYHRCLQIWV